MEYPPDTPTFDDLDRIVIIVILTALVPAHELELQPLNYYVELKQERLKTIQSLSPERQRELQAKAVRKYQRRHRRKLQAKAKEEYQKKRHGTAKFQRAIQTVIQVCKAREELLIKTLIAEARKFFPDDLEKRDIFIREIIRQRLI